MDYYREIIQPIQGSRLLPSCSSAILPIHMVQDYSPPCLYPGQQEEGKRNGRACPLIFQGIIQKLHTSLPLTSHWPELCCYQGGGKGRPHAQVKVKDSIQWKNRRIDTEEQLAVSATNTHARVCLLCVCDEITAISLWSRGTWIHRASERLQEDERWKPAPQS